LYLITKIFLGNKICPLTKSLSESCTLHLEDSPVLKKEWKLLNSITDDDYSGFEKTIDYIKKDNNWKEF
jgi:hypothetical protein